MHLYLSDRKAKMWRKNGTANDPKHTASSVKHAGDGVMAWACMAVSGTGPLNFIYKKISELLFKKVTPVTSFLHLLTDSAPCEHDLTVV